MGLGWNWWIEFKFCRYREVEGGFSLFKNIKNGIVIATDNKGRPSSYFKGGDNKDNIIICTVVIKAQKTFYS